MDQNSSKMDHQNGQNQSKIDQFNQNGPKRSSFMMDFIIFDGFWSISDLLINILIENGSKSFKNGSKSIKNG